MLWLMVNTINLLDINVAGMVDCDYFTDFNKDLTIETNRILLEFKKCNYALELYPPIYPDPSPSPHAKKRLRTCQNTP